MIPAVDRGLEQLLRAAVPLSDEVADISFDAPDGTWGTQLSRITVNLFLFDVSASPLPSLPPAARARSDGRTETRPPLSLIRLNYLVSAWAGDTADEHHILGAVLSCFVNHRVLPEVYLPTTPPNGVHLALSQREGRKPGELWGSLQGKLKPSFELEATVAVDAPWELAPTAVTQVEGRVDRQPAVPTDSGLPPQRPGSEPDRPQIIRRRSGSAVVAEGRPAAGS